MCGESGVQRKWIAIAVVGLVAIGSGCSGDDEEDEAQDAAPIPQQIWTGELEDGGYSDHPVRRSVERCRFLDALDVMLIRQAEQEGDVVDFERSDVQVERLAPMVGVDLERADDEFEENQLLEEAEERLADRLDGLVGSPLCVEFDLYVDEYDFDDGVVELSERGLMTIFRVPQDTWDASAQGLPEGYEIPLPVVFMAENTGLPMSADRAEEFFADLPRVETQKEDDEEDSQDVYFTKPPLDIWPVEALEALEGSERIALLYRDGSEGEWVRKIEADLAPEPGVRKAEAMAVVAPWGDEGYATVPIETGDESIRIPILLMAADQLMVRSPDGGGVQQVWPDDAGVDFDDVEIEEPDFDAHRSYFDQICDGEAKRQTRTQMMHGELREEEFKGCSPCPPIAGQGERFRDEELKFEEVIRGHFSRPGANEILVRNRGCGGSTHGGEYVTGGVSLLRQRVGGSSTVVDYTTEHYRECEFVETGRGTTLPICKQGMYGDLGTSWHVLFVGTQGFHPTPLFVERHDYRNCLEQPRCLVTVEDVEIVDGEDDDRQLRIVATEESPEDSEEVELRYHLTPTGPEATEATKERLAQLDAAER